MSSDIELIAIPFWSGQLGQGNHGQASSKMSDYLKDIQSFLVNLANKVKNLEEDNLRLRNDNANLRNQLDKRKETSPEASSDKWNNFFKKGCNAKSSQEEVMLVEKVFEETKERNAKANNVVISGMLITPGGDTASDKQVVLNILQEIGIQNPNAKVKRFRRMVKASVRNESSSTKPAPVVVEFCDKETQLRVLKSAKNLNKSSVHGENYINPDLTKNEMAIEKELRRRRNSENEKLPLGEEKLKYGKQSDGTEYYWRIRFGRLCCIIRVTKKSITQ